MPAKMRSVPSKVGQSLVLAVGRVLPEDLGVRVVGRADEDLRPHGLAVDIQVHVVVLPSLVGDGIGRQGPDLLALDRDRDRDVPAGPEVAVAVGDVDLGLEGARGRVEREPRADHLPLAGGARDRLKADQRGVLLVDEVGGQLGDAHEDADRVDLLEHEKRHVPACRRRARGSRPG